MEYAVPGSLDAHRNLIVHYHKARGKPDMLIVIEGVVLPDRRKFRPSDWTELLPFATKNNLNICMKEGSIPHVDGLASGITEEVRRDAAAYDALVH
ncbi:MAG: hypothetical protein ACYDDD_00750 [Acidithiobacillus ferrivorans]